MRSSELGLAAGLVALFILTLPGVSLAYCRTSSCMEGGQHTAQVCTPAQPGDCGVVLQWPKPCAQWSLQEDASSQVSFAQMEKIVADGFNTWMSAPCPGGGTPNIKVTQGEPVSCAKHEYNQTQRNANIIVFRDGGWPYPGQYNTLGLTTVTYNLDTGDIYDADLEINSADNNFTFGDTDVDFDLPSIMTHELGHFLGLAHTPVATATMFASYQQHTTNLRYIQPDDIAGICAIYPPPLTTESCDPTPRHGFSPLCSSEQPPNNAVDTDADDGSGGCSTTVPGGWAGGPGVMSALASMVLAARRARRRRSS